MTPPPRLWNVEWHEVYRDRAQERRYRSARAAARQVASVLAAPDDVSTLKGVWLSTGWRSDRIDWTPLDPAALLSDVADAQAAELDQHDAEDDAAMTVVDHYRTIAAAWRDHHERKPA